MQDAIFPVVSLVDVLSGEVEPERFTDKIVLIGLINSTGITDQYTVPSAQRGQLMAGVEIQANAIETLLQNRVIYEQNIIVQYTTIILLAIGSSILYMQLNWYLKLISWGVLSLLALVIASVLFEHSGEIVNLFDNLLALALPIVATTGIDITNEITRRRQSEFLLHSVVHVSQQRLRLSKILPHIVEDIHRIVPSSQILIWRCDQHPDKPQEIYRWPENLQLKEGDLLSLAHDVARTGKPSVHRAQVVLPIAWRRRLIAVYAVKVTGIAGIPRRTVSLLQRLAEQLAPSMESAFLYTEVEQQSAIRDAILNGSPAGILVLDHALRITGMNAMLDSIFKVQFSGFIDQPFMTMLDFIGIQEKNRQDIINALQVGKPFRRELTLRSHIFSLEAAPLEEFKRWVLVLTEITHLIQLTQLKTYIIRMLSHDLGNPLSRVLGYTQLIVSDRDRFPEEHQMYLDYILSSGEEMDRIIAEVLALEELRSSEFTLTGLDMSELVRNFCKQYAPNMLPKKQTFTWDVPEKPIFVSGNHRQLTQVLMNLLSNASKYTPDGGHIAVALTIHDHHFARLSVQDDGYGIPEKSQSQIFTEFFRVKSDITREIEGTGLGLSMVKVVIDNHNGRIWFESTEGVGTTFFVELPLFKDKSH